MPVDLPPELSGLNRWGFGDAGPLRDELTALALAGTKTTTASLLHDFEPFGEAVPRAGSREILIDSDERPVAVVDTLEVDIVRLADVTDRHAIDEGEGYTNAAGFRAAHEGYWNSYIDDVRSRIGDPSFVLDDDTLIVCERFRIVATIDRETGAITWYDVAG